MRPEEDMLNAPSAISRRAASRAGLVDTPNVRARPRSVSACAGSGSPCITCAQRA
jgi:hypothetical protein